MSWSSAVSTRAGSLRSTGDATLAAAGAAPGERMAMGAGIGAADGPGWSATLTRRVSVTLTVRATACPSTRAGCAGDAVLAAVSAGRTGAGRMAGRYGASGNVHTGSLADPVRTGAGTAPGNDAVTVVGRAPPTVLAVTGSVLSAGGAATGVSGASTTWPVASLSHSCVGGKPLAASAERVGRKASHREGTAATAAPATPSMAWSSQTPTEARPTPAEAADAEARTVRRRDEGRAVRDERWAAMGEVELTWRS